MLTVSLLGPLELRRDDVPIPVRPGKSAEVLIRLALDAGELVRTERLIDDLWAGAAAGRNTVQAKVSSLRRSLGDAATITGTSAGYTLQIDPSAVDALNAPLLAARASALLTKGDAAGAVATCSTALALFRAEVLCDAGDGEWIAPHRARLEETRVQLVEDLFSARLQLGAAGDLTAELESLVADHPLREGLWAVLITALYRDGRQADALAAYTRIRTVLGEELGIEPGTALRALERQVLDQDPALDGRPRRAPGNLPVLRSSMVARDAELSDLIQRVVDEPLVSIVGPAGVGKTRLAIEVASLVERYAGSWIVRLDAADADSVGATVAAAFGVASGTEAALLEHLQGSDPLLVIDNCEHVLDAVAELAPRLLDVAPGLRLLVTSQAPLAIDGEHVMALGPLDIDASVALFGERATGHRSTVHLDGDAVVEVCRALDGLPLAIELAAARTKTLSVDEIARRIDDRFALLRDPSSRQPERRRALVTAIEWSYDLLFPDDQRALWALACFADGARLDAFEVVLAALDVPPLTALDVVTRLVDRSLVAVDTSGAVARYSLLDSVRAFGLDRVREAGVLDVARDAHASWYADAAAVSAAEVRGPSQAPQLALVREERANIDAALAWSDPLEALAIANGFGWAWVVIGEGAFAGGRLRRAIGAAGPDGTPADVACAWATVAWLEAGNDASAALDAAECALAAADDDITTATADLALGFVLIQAGRPRDRLVALERCRAVFVGHDCAWEIGAANLLTVHAALFAGDDERAARACVEAELVIRAIGDDWGIGHLEATLGQVARMQTRYADAARHLTGAAEAAHRLGFATSEGYHLVNLGRVQAFGGEPDAALATLEHAIDIGRASAELRIVTLAQVQMARVLWAQGERDAARACVVDANDWYQRNGGGEQARVAAVLLAAIDGDGAMLERLLEEARAEGDTDAEQIALEAS